MTIFAEVIKNLYAKEDITAEKVYNLLQTDKLTKEEYLIILGKDEE